VIIGFDWLRKHNPLIDWCTGNIVFTRCPSPCSPISGNEELEEEPCVSRSEKVRVRGIEEGDRIFDIERRMQQDVRAMGTRSQKLAEEALQVKPGASLNGLIPKYLEDFAPVFEKASFDRLPE
ncbi:hypothetical protein M405DRAFT_710246, partial [Rhizopogon salebrosus TDB-379]